MGIQPHPMCKGLSWDKQGGCWGLSQDSYNASAFKEPQLVSVTSCSALGLYVGDALAADTFRLFCCLKKKEGGIVFIFGSQQTIPEFCIFRVYLFFYRILISDKCRHSLGYVCEWGIPVGNERVGLGNEEEMSVGNQICQHQMKNLNFCWNLK